VEVTGKTILMLTMQENDAGATTIQDYLLLLLKNVWKYGEGFDGKRPFGNSGWEGELYQTLARADLITSARDEDGYYYDFDEAEGNRLISLAIEALA